MRHLFENFTSFGYDYIFRKNWFFGRDNILYFYTEEVGHGPFENLTFFGSDYIFRKNPFFRKNNIRYFTNENVDGGTF